MRLLALLNLAHNESYYASYVQGFSAAALLFICDQFLMRVSPQQHSSSHLIIIDGRPGRRVP
jgi:hypothetical protein